MALGDWLGKYLGDWLGYTSGGSPDVTIACGIGTAAASGQAASIISSSVADPRLDQILALLTGKKVYDPATKLWRVYSPDNTEIADESGILMRGLHGWMLASGNNAGNGQQWIIQARRRHRR